MKKTGSLLLLFLAVSYGIISFLYLENIISYQSFISTIYAGLLNLLNLGCAYLLFNLSLKKPNKLFVLYNLSGIGIRIFLMLALIALSIKFLKIDKYAFILVFFLFYFVLLSFEVRYILSKKDLIKGKST